jgi:hypothetical protein
MRHPSPPARTGKSRDGDVVNPKRRPVTLRERIRHVGKHDPHQYPFWDPHRDSYQGATLVVPLVRREGSGLQPLGAPLARFSANKTSRFRDRNKTDRTSFHKKRKAGPTSPALWRFRMKHGRVPPAVPTNYLFTFFAVFPTCLFTAGTPLRSPCCSIGPSHRLPVSISIQNNCPPFAW